MTVTAPTGLLDPTGKDDCAAKIQNWIASVPNGQTARISPGTYRVEDAVTISNRIGLSLDCNGVKFVQRVKRPFVVLADPSNGNKNPAGKWNIVYTPTNTIRQTYEGRLNEAPAVDRANDKCKLLNRARSFFKLNKCDRVTLRGVQPTGMAGIDPYFSDDFEAANGIDFYGCVDCELDDCEVGQMFGNGIQANAYVESDGTYIPTTRLWVHDSGFSDFGRQACSLSYGGAYILERCDLAGSLNGRSLIDCEPTTNRNPPGQEATVEGVYVIDNRIGKHRLGMIAAGLTRGDVRWIYVARNVGNGIGISGTSVARGVIFEDNVDTGTDVPPNMCKFVMGPQWGARAVIVRRNKKRVSEAGVKFHDGQGNGGVYMYQVVDNDFGGRPQFIDNNVPKWSGTFKPFALPIPAHALRDL